MSKECLSVNTKSVRDTEWVLLFSLFLDQILNFCTWFTNTLTIYCFCIVFPTSFFSCFCSLLLFYEILDQIWRENGWVKNTEMRGDLVLDLLPCSLVTSGKSVNFWGFVFILMKQRVGWDIFQKYIYSMISLWRD